MTILGHGARIVSTEGEGFASEVHFLKFGFIVPCAIFDRQIDIRGVGTGGVGEDAGGGLTQVNSHLFSLGEGMFADEVHFEGFIGFGSHFHGLVEQVHLVDEQVAEYARTVDHHIDAGATEFFKGEHLEFVDPT